jgi:hypothetical protein
MNIKDSLKFGVLIGLLEVSSRVTRNKEVVDAVLHLVSTFSLSIVASTDPVNLLLFLKMEFHSQGRIVTGYSVGLCDKFFQVKMLLH